MQNLIVIQYFSFVGDGGEIMGEMFISRLCDWVQRRTRPLPSDRWKDLPMRAGNEKLVCGPLLLG